jgi:hypothetical protein
MISIGGGLKPRASQRYRNNCLTLEWKMGSRQIFWVSAEPPTMQSPGAGGMPSDLTA